MSKILINLEIEAMIEEDISYYGDKETLAKTIDMIKNVKVPQYRVFIAKGKTDPKEIQSKIKVKTIAFINLEK